MTKAIRAEQQRESGGDGEVGQRLRSLRMAAGLTQSQLAGGRFSKEYVSQIERGKTRPGIETLEWLAGQLDVEPAYLIGGVSAEERGRVEAALSRAEALSERGEHADAAETFAAGRQAVAETGAADLELRSLLGETWALAQSGSVQEALRLLERARDLAESPACSHVDRAAVLFRFGVCRYHLSSISTAISLLTAALELADRSGLPCDQLRCDILDWRSRCYRRQRDWQAAREDVERALELAEAGRDRGGTTRSSRTGRTSAGC
jgi:transcriptional regulator with XRE-family HTH domain